MYRADRRRGMSLIEILVATAVVAILFTLVATMLTPVMRASARESARMELDQMAATAMERMVSDLRKSSPVGISFVPAGGPAEPVVLAIVRVDDVTADGTRVWEPEAVVYVFDPTRKRLTRKTWPPAPPAPGGITFLPDRPPVIPRSVLADVAVQANQTERSVAGEVESFTVSHARGTGPDLQQPLELHLELERDVPGREEPSHFELTRQVYLRN